MAIDKENILRLSTDEKRQLAFELHDSIDEEYSNQPLQEWKVQLIKQRIHLDRVGPKASRQWSEIREKYNSR